MIHEILTNLTFTITESYNLMITLVLIDFVTNRMLDKEKITAKQSCISAIVLIPAVILLLSASQQNTLHYVFVVIISMYVLSAVLCRFKMAFDEMIFYMFAAPDNTVIAVRQNDREWWFIAYDEKNGHYKCYHNCSEIVNMSPEELFTSTYVDVLHSDTYSYREKYNLITGNKAPESEDYVLRPLWSSNIRMQFYEDWRDKEVGEIIVTVLNNTHPAKIGNILTRFTVPKDGYHEFTLSPAQKENILKELRNGVSYKTDIQNKKEDIVNEQ